LPPCGPVVRGIIGWLGRRLPATGTFGYGAGAVGQRRMHLEGENMDVRVYACRNALAGNHALAAIRRLETTGGVEVELLPCSGRIDPRYVLKAFEGGAAAVCVLACPVGQCQSIEGNLRLERRTRAVRELMAEAGLDPASLQVFHPQGSGELAAEAAMDALERFVHATLRPLHELVA
jgi:coenzyme F420-reducing hydrogenase delta subunit